MIMNNLFYELVQLSLGTRKEFSSLPTESEWISMLEEADRQCIVGFTFQGVERAVKIYGGISNANLNPDIVGSWYNYEQKVEEANRDLNNKSAWLQKWFDKQGMHSCILKGQGNALLYPNPLSRHSGDIDIWVWKKDLPNDGENNRLQIIDWVRKRSTSNDLEVCYHHIQLEPLDDVEVEAHFWPSFFFCLPRLRKFEKWCTNEHLSQMNNWKDLPDGNGRISTPTLEFNLVFQLIHIMRHLFAEGIGMRHIIDYYWTLWHYNSSVSRDLHSLRSTLHLFGLEAIAGGIMWIMKDILGMSSDMLICSPNESVGKLLLSEVERGGNFGHADESAMQMLERNKLQLFFWRTWRNVKIFKICPTEVLWGPIYRIRQWLFLR